MIYQHVYGHARAPCLLTGDYIFAPKSNSAVYSPVHARYRYNLTRGDCSHFIVGKGNSKKKAGKQGFNSYIVRFNSCPYIGHFNPLIINFSPYVVLEDPVKVHSSPYTVHFSLCLAHPILTYYTSILICIVQFSPYTTVLS